ncbi:class I SAM-dependent methyltransferase, partial [Bacillus sp. D-CC]
ISKTAIDLAKQNGLEDISIYHGSVNEMPFDNKSYDGIFSHALLHLLSEQERVKFIKDCYNQLKPGGYMVFTTVSKKAPMYGKGKQLEQDYYEIMESVKMFLTFFSRKKSFAKIADSVGSKPHIVCFSIKLDSQNSIMILSPCSNP